MKQVISLLTLILLFNQAISQDQECFDKIPNQSFCNENYECQKCKNPDCLTCLSDLNTCTQCINKYLYNNQCKDSQPQGTYCDQSTKICTKCKVDYCTDCQNNVNACQQCDKQSQFLYLYLNKCLNSKPDYITCDSNNLCTTKPPTYCTANCQSCNYLTKECYQCSNGFTKLLSQPPTLPTCVTSQPLNSSLESQQFIQCPQFCSQCDSKFNCLQCQNNYYFLNKMCQICQQQNYGPNKSSQICEQCQVPKCQNCISDSSICNKCANGYFLTQNTCQPNHPLSNYCDERNICIPCNNGCATCDQYGNCNTCSAGCVQCNYQNYCTACEQNLKIQNKECLCEQGYYNPSLQVCQSCESISQKADCNQQNKSQCYFFDDQNKCLDMKSQILYCNEQSQCYQMKPKNTYCLKDTSNKTPFNKYLCKQCHQFCQECTGSTNNECRSCIQEAILKNTTCEQLFLIYNSKVYTRDKIEQATQQTQTTSQAAVGSTYALSAAQNIFSSSSFAILSTGLSCQKLSYLILVNINLPNQIYSPLEKLKNQLPSQQFKTLNIFKPLINANLITYPDIRFESVDLSYHILYNCGQAIILFLICLTLFTIFYLLTEKFQIEKVVLYSQKVYQAVFSSFIIQYFQLSMTIFVIGINTQIKYFINISDYEQLAIKIPLIIALFTLSIALYQQQYHYLNRIKSKQEIIDFYEITRQKILNEAVFESKPRRNFILIYLFIESVIIPTYFIQFSSSWKIVSIISIVIQVLQLGFIIYLMPFFSKLTNWFFILNSLLWLGLYIQYYLLNFYSSQPDVDNHAITLDNISYCFLISIQFALLINPIYLILSLFVKLYEYFKKWLQEKKIKKQTEGNFTLNRSFYNNGQELQNNLKIYQSQSLDFELSCQNKFDKLVQSRDYIRKIKKF
ncbi:hypothetical protein ABPG72_006247 [Tetrahymena utriculariae]